MTSRSVEECAPAAGQDVPTAGRELRRRLVWIQKALLDLDRLESAEAVENELWRLARSLRLRTIRLRAEGPHLVAEAADGFASLESESQWPQTVGPLEPQGLFAAAADEKAVYSGPRPSQGMPVDLVLRMGRERPAWCLVIPRPVRHRWVRFLYVEALPEQLDGILQLDPVARLAVQQLRAARWEPHRPAQAVRAFQDAALRQRLAPAGAQGAHAKDDAPVAAVDRFTRKRHPTRSPLTPPSPERFDADGVLTQPLPPAEIESRVGVLPALPPTAAMVLGLLADPETTVPALEEVITGDPDLSDRLLHVANSSQFGSLRDCQSVSEAIVRLGFTAIRSWLLAGATRRLFLPEDASPLQRAAWQQSVVAAVAAQRLAEITPVTDPETAFLGGLLQNVGALLLARDHGGVFEEIARRAAEENRPPYAAERTRLGFDHADLSAVLLARWELPAEVVEAVRLHHRLDEAGDHEAFAALIALSERLALHAAAEAAPGDLLETREVELLRLQPDDVAAVARRLEPMLLDRNLMT